MSVALSVLLSAAVLFLVLAVLIRSRLQASGQETALSPEPLEPASGEIDPMDVAFKALLDETPGDCLVHNLLAEWSEGKSCTLCSKELAVDHGQQGSALMSPDRVTFEWSDVSVEEISEILATHQPICWDCHIIETLYRMHPELITEREPSDPWLESDPRRGPRAPGRAAGAGDSRGPI